MTVARTSSTLFRQQMCEIFGGQVRSRTPTQSSTVFRGWPIFALSAKVGLFPSGATAQLDVPPRRLPREPRVRAVLAARLVIDRDVKIEHARIAHSERLYGCGLYLEPVQ